VTTPPDPSAGPTASVAIATYNRAALLPRLTAALDAQAVGGGVEVVVYDDASRDGSAEFLQAWATRSSHTVRILRGEHNAGPARGRNVAWRAGTGRVVAFTDDDCEPQPGWLAALVAAVPDEGTVAVGRTGPPADQADRDGPFARTLRVEDTRYLQTCNVAYPRSLLEQLGGFDESFRRAAGEDTDLGLRALEAGARAVFVPAAVVHHDVRRSDLRLALREATKWIDLPLVVRKHPEVRKLLHRRYFWKDTHPNALLALAGLLGAARRPACLLLVLPWLRQRGWPRSARVAAGWLAIDLTEVATVARGSVRHGCLLL
jgi:GT2 family glycosyltransferase